MRGDPRWPRPETKEISTTPPTRQTKSEAVPPAFRSRHPKPEVLMGEVAGPRGQEIGAGRDALRGFMLSRRLAPTSWAKEAGVPASEILAYLTGGTRHLSAVTAAKLAEAAGVAPDELFAAKKNGGL
jgi:hypothetical protein